MALHGKIETTLELKSSAEKFYKVWRSQSFHVPKHASKHIQGVDIHAGDWETVGSIRIWQYTIGGKAGVFKEEVSFDDENKIITLNGLEGDVMKIYKVYRPIWQLTPKGSGCLAKLTIEYEKLHPEVPVPEIYVDFMVHMTKDIDESLSTEE
ncbi:MLP-like protein 28 [Populus alba x Populus x berolinensis]|uniref:Bet v I/Major latex protein domain-containing protein n=1 Tax=Populus davidiana TaxID=266767 RepID=A0A6M2ECW4_9ROSI|nr:MLP-like protein 28 [Populus alba x Populus x berolinensis]